MVEAWEVMDRERKVENGACRWWARYDSRPEEKAKEPSGRAESARRKRKCGDGDGGEFVSEISLEDCF